MKRYFITPFFILIAYISFSQNVIHHKINVNLNPKTSDIEVTDFITLPAEEVYIFSLNADLEILTNSKNVRLKKIEENIPADDVGMDRDENSGNLKINKYKVRLKGNNRSFEIKYKGFIKSETKQSETNYQRGFSESPGIICEKGVYLAGSTFWVPTIENSLVTFSVTAFLPDDWKSVSQGKRFSEKLSTGKQNDTWVCNKPQEEIFLIAAPFTEYQHTMNNGVKAMAFLRTPDENLANKYLEVTEQYMNMYSELLANYPYPKFALVENFWETGYGMPSFTLLGEKIIRFPFILHSSYPHELLHNWWGNSVYVDFNKGNWCEGITAYMADHLIKEQRGQGEEYRRSTLKKFTDFVTTENDFPLSKFIARHNASSEAIGYGKALMVWHMLRRKLGDETFVKGWRKFYSNYKFKVASFEDIRKTMDTVSGIDLQPFFNQWINRTGAPQIIINDVSTNRFNNQYRIFLTLEQTQPDEAFVIDIPIAVVTKKGVRVFTVNMKNKKESYQLFTDNEPLKLGIDPQYDVFRKVDPKEVPPALSKIWASKENVIILPAKADKMKKEVYITFANRWKESDNDHFEIIYDSEISSLPTGKTPWIIGIENKFTDSVNSALNIYGAYINSDSVKTGNKTLPVNDNSFIITVFNPKNANKNYVFIQPGNMDAITGLVRKLPHYGKYSFLAFEGNEPVNIDKGMWPVINSPVIKVLNTNGKNLSQITERKALAYIKPLFSENRMMQHIKYLASDKMKGRGLGTPELDTVADYIAGQFKKYGLKPIDSSYFQTFTQLFPNKPGDKKLILKNVIAVISGTDDKLKEEPVVVSAHYDHLGTGWPDVHAGDEGKIHYGANDNASGIAILLELAKNMAKLKPKRTIIFVAFTGEEAGLIGSRYFVAHSKNYFKDKIFANINLDTDGSLFDKKLMVLNGNTAREWKFIFMGTDYTTGIKTEVVTTDLDASDQVAFIEKDIPAVQLFTGATENYHRPSDTWDKIDGKGLVKVATVAKEVIEYLADRSEPMPFTGKGGSHKKPQLNNNSKTGKRASTGSIPDFTFSGPGVKISSVIGNSPAQKAGLKAGDVIIKVNNDEVKDLRNYTSILKKYKPGETATFTILHNGKKKDVKLTFKER